MKRWLNQATQTPRMDFLCFLTTFLGLLTLSYGQDLSQFVFSRTSLGQKLENLLQEHKVKVQNYIMTGYGGGWEHCDVLSLNPIDVGAPQFLMEFKTFSKLDIRSALSSSHCLLAAQHIESKEDLSAIIKFGWKVISHKRIALILSMAKGITLEMTPDIEKLPFIIVARLEGGGEQFLCPVIGRAKPLLQGHMCDISYASYKYKKLRVGISGVVPHFFLPKGNGVMDGTHVRLLSLLAEKLKFMPDVVVPRTFEQGANMVKNKKNYMLFKM